MPKFDNASRGLVSRVERRGSSSAVAERRGVLQSGGAWLVQWRKGVDHGGSALGLCLLFPVFL